MAGAGNIVGSVVGLGATALQALPTERDRMLQRIANGGEDPAVAALRASIYNQNLRSAMALAATDQSGNPALAMRSAQSGLAEANAGSSANIAQMAGGLVQQARQEDQIGKRRDALLAGVGNFANTTATSLATQDAELGANKADPAKYSANNPGADSLSTPPRAAQADPAQYSAQRLGQPSRVAGSTVPVDPAVAAFRGRRPVYADQFDQAFGGAPSDIPMVGPTPAPQVAGSSLQMRSPQGSGQNLGHFENRPVQQVGDRGDPGRPLYSYSIATGEELGPMTSLPGYRPPAPPPQYQMPEFNVQAQPLTPPVPSQQYATEQWRQQTAPVTMQMGSGPAGGSGQMGQLGSYDSLRQSQVQQALAPQPQQQPQQMRQPQQRQPQQPQQNPYQAPVYQSENSYAGQSPWMAPREQAAMQSPMQYPLMDQYHVGTAQSVDHVAHLRGNPAAQQLVALYDRAVQSGDSNAVASIMARLSGAR